MPLPVHGRTDSMISAIDEGGSSRRLYMPRAIKHVAIMKADCELQHISSLMQDSDWVRKCRVEFDVDNWDERKSKRQSLISFATALLKDNPAWNRRALSFERYIHTESAVKSQSFSWPRESDCY